MDAPGDNADRPALPAEALEAIHAPRAPDAPRRCFICLTDEEPGDPPGTWVDPCPCTLEAHQDCMLSWVVDRERSRMPLQCPVCKEPIRLEGQWDPLVALNDAVHRHFTSTSPFVLFTGTALGVQASLLMYGTAALSFFAGQDVAADFLPVGDGATLASAGPHFAKTYIRHAFALTSIAPALLLGRVFPGLSNKIGMPTGCLYGLYHAMRDEHFFSWPPSPQLAMAAFPYIRSAYYNLWREFVLPYDTKLTRQLTGQPPTEPRRNDGPNNRHNAERNREGGGVVGLLQHLLDELDPDEAGGEGNGADQIRVEEVHVEEQEGRDGEVMVELVIEEQPEDPQDAWTDDTNSDEGAQDQPEDPLDAPPVPAPAPAAEDAPRPVQDEREDAAEAPVVPPAAQPQQPHDVPQPPPARQGLGALLSTMSNAIASTLILPGIAFAAGEALRVLVLPRSWTVAPARGGGGWLSYGPARRPGLFQNQWGRSLVGGCVYVVLRDAVSVYAKHRRVAAMGNRRVKNVDGRRERRQQEQQRR